MAQGTLYQGAWQSSVYQGAWQAQAQALSKTVSDTLGIADSVVLGTGKAFSETLSISDAVAHAASKVLADTFGISDAMLISQGLTLADAMGIGDAIVLEFGLNVADQQGMSDSLSFDFGMNLADAFGISDTFIVGTALYFSDALAITDAVSMIRDVGIALADTFGMSDSVALLSSKSLSDAMGLGDNVVFAIGKGLSDNLSMSDAKVLSMGKGLSDIVAITDALFKALTIGEQIVGLKRIAEVLANAPNETQAWMPYIGIGSSNIEGDEIRDTNLWSELHRKLGTVTSRANTYFIRATFGQDEPTGDGLTIREVGIFDAETGGKLGKRWVLPNEESKDNIDEVVVECAVTILHGTREAHTLDDITDTFGITDSISLRLFGTLLLPSMGSGTERMPITDAYLPEVGKGFLDQMGISDASGFEIGKGFLDQMGISDGIALEVGKSFSDQMGITDRIDWAPQQFSLYGLVYTGASPQYVFCNGRRRDTGAYGIVCFDVQDRENPVYVSWTEVDPAVYGRAWYDIVQVASGLNTYLLLAMEQYTPTPVSGGILVVDITNELIPVIIDKYDTAPGWDGVTPSTTSTFHLGIDPLSPYVYIAIYDSHATMGVQKVNRGTPSNLFLTSNWNTSFFDDGYDYGEPPIGYSQFEQWNGIPPPPPARMWGFNGAYDAKLGASGDPMSARLYVATGGQVWEFDPANFGVVESVRWICDTPGNSQALFVAGSTAMTMYRGDWPNDFKALLGVGCDPTSRDPVTGQCDINVSTTWRYNRIQRFGITNFAVAASANRLEIINHAVASLVSSLNIPARQGEIQTADDGHDYLYVAAYTDGLYIYNVDDKASPVLESQSFGWWS